MTKTLYIILAIVLIGVSALITITFIKLFFKGMLFLVTHPIQSIIFLIVFWLMVKIAKSIIC